MHINSIAVSHDAITLNSLILHVTRASPMSVLPLGSDFPVESVNPFLGFYAITRLSADGLSPHRAVGWFADQKLTSEQALKQMTIDAAYAAFEESEIGFLSPGKKDDFIVLNRNIMTVPPEDILDSVRFGSGPGDILMTRPDPI